MRPRTRPSLERVLFVSWPLLLLPLAVPAVPASAKLPFRLLRAEDDDASAELPPEPGAAAAGGVPSPVARQAARRPVAKALNGAVCFSHREKAACLGARNARCIPCVWLKDGLYGEYCSDPSCGLYGDERSCCENALGADTGCFWNPDAKSSSGKRGLCLPQTCGTLASGMCEGDFDDSTCRPSQDVCRKAPGCQTTCAGCRPNGDSCNCGGLETTCASDTSSGTACPPLQCYRCLMAARTVQEKDQLRKPGGACFASCIDVVHCDVEIACLTSVLGGSGGGSPCSEQPIKGSSCDGDVSSEAEAILPNRSCKDICGYVETLCGSCGPTACSASGRDMQAVKAQAATDRANARAMPPTSAPTRAKLTGGARPGVDYPIHLPGSASAGAASNAARAAGGRPGIDYPIIVSMPGPPGAAPGARPLPPGVPPGPSAADAAGVVRGVDVPILMPGPPGPPGPPGASPHETVSTTRTATGTTKTVTGTTLTVTTNTITASITTTATTATFTATGTTMTATATTATATMRPKRRVVQQPFQRKKAAAPLPAMTPLTQLGSVHHLM